MAASDALDTSPETTTTTADVAEAASLVAASTADDASDVTLSRADDASLASEASDQWLAIPSPKDRDDTPHIPDWTSLTTLLTSEAMLDASTLGTGTGSGTTASVTAAVGAGSPVQYGRTKDVSWPPTVMGTVMPSVDPDGDDSATGVGEASDEGGDDAGGVVGGASPVNGGRVISVTWPPTVRVMTRSWPTANAGNRAARHKDEINMVRGWSSKRG